MRLHLLSAAVLAALAGSAQAAEPLSVEERLKAMEARISALETEAKHWQTKATNAMAEAKAAKAEAAAAKANAATAQAVATSAQSTAVSAQTVASSAQSAADNAAQSVAAAPAGDSGSGNANAFNPALSVILNGTYAHTQRDPADYAIDGFHVGEESGPLDRGLSLGETEIALSANVDDKFYGQVTAAIESEDGEDHLGIEEAYLDTTALPDGFTARVGRFFSNIGYLNSHHAHTDSFVDRPLVYQTLLDTQYGDDGVQLRWVAPTDLYLEVGGELFRGQNYPSGGARHDGVGVHTAFVHLGGDVGESNSWLAGLSVLDSKTEGADDGFSGDQKLYIGDFTWKWAPNGNSKAGGLTFRSEYFLDDRDGEFTDEDGITSPWDGKRRGAYAETVYRFNPTWEAGYRYDKLWADDSGPVASDYDPRRHSLMLDWKNSEFSLVRLQYNRDEAQDGLYDNQWYLQYQATFGAHGAHKF